MTAASLISKQVTTLEQLNQLSQTGLYRPDFEHENCGFGMMAHMDDQASHKLVQTAIESLSKMTHRGGVAADCCSGDGCGLLIKKPDGFFRTLAQQQAIDLPDIYAVGMVFFNPDKAAYDFAKQALTVALQNEGLEVVMWRDVPVNSAILGQQAAASEPKIEQVFVQPTITDEDEAAFDRHLFTARRLAEKAVAASDMTDDAFYIASLHSQLISYKGLVMPKELMPYFLDLQQENFASSCVSYHQRFSTNTLPQWKLAQPFRLLAHNGEINTIRGNRNWARAREKLFATPLLPKLNDLQPVVSQTGSDSSSLDNLLELLQTGGMNIFRALRMVIPPAWQNVTHMDADLRAFLDFSSMHMEPWDGPAGMVINTGRYAICGVDRNGLRPTRYVITKDRHIIFASEVGTYDYDPLDVVEKGRLKPGQLMAVDLATGELLQPSDIDNHLKGRFPYRQWMDKGITALENEEMDVSQAVLNETDALIHQKYFQVTFEERDQVIRVLAESGQEATGSMGDDAPLPVFSTKVRSVVDYFRQMFAQVTNPPIDPLRENIVMSLYTVFGREKNLFEVDETHAQRIELTSPVLLPSEFEQITHRQNDRYQTAELSLTYDPQLKGLQQAIVDMCAQAESMVLQGVTILVVSDANLAKEQVVIPSVMATGALHHHLIKQGLRPNVNLVIKTGAARDPHHFAVLIGYGATAIYPYLAYSVLADLQRSHELDDDVSLVTYLHNYRTGINKGLFKILSKMGISTITSYRGAQLFEIVGLSDAVVDLCFDGTTSRIQGADFDDLQADQIKLSQLAFNPRKSLQQGGLLKYVFGGEDHAFNPEVVNALRKAVTTGDKVDYDRYKDLVNGRKTHSIRDLLKPVSDQAAIALDQVESVRDIVQRFDSAGISLGALSPEAHEALAIAMNRLGGRSNSGEGAEDPSRYGTEKMSKIKQVASGRFGVTPHYLVNAEVIQIKVAQGAKPGEGGQLPGHKVNKMIATLRHSVPGVTLISPPPHHDIYSIEDLAQLIFDLKQVNPQAKISVKLVAEPGVGTIAAGVAKAYADLITISGFDGGTGASPITSVKYAGSPFELGIAEAHQVLRANDLRGQVALQADGGLKTGLDVIKAAMLGAESFGFGTAPMIALGCKYLRICHLNTCAVGVATQNERLRNDHFIGAPEMAMNYFRFVAEEVREILAELGFTSLKDVVGRSDLLEILPGNTPKQQKLNLTPLLDQSAIDPTAPQYQKVAFNYPWDGGELAEEMVEQVLPAIENKSGGIFNFQLVNTARAIGARLSGEIAKRYGNQNMESAPITLKLSGVAGQSFGVWNAGGLHLHLEGDANDYVGKGMAGGEIVIVPPQGSVFDAHTTPIIGNTCLYGATGGKLFACGTAGERFGVRNSGATAVVESLGDHGCEYMTGGTVVSLSSTGVNFGAGMSGGMAFVLDNKATLQDRINPEMVEIYRIDTEETHAYRHYLKSLLTEYVEKTGSSKGQDVLKDFSRYVTDFWLVKPKALDLDSLLKLFLHAA